MAVIGSLLQIIHRLISLVVCFVRIGNNFFRNIQFSSRNFRCFGLIQLCLQVFNVYLTILIEDLAALMISSQPTDSRMNLGDVKLGILLIGKRFQNFLCLWLNDWLE